MTIRWTAEARENVDRLVDFVAACDPVRATEIEQELSEAPRRLLRFPRRGSRLSEFEMSEVREFRIENYLLRYELRGSDIFVLRFFHSRENRFWDPLE